MTFMADNNPRPVSINLHKQSRVLEIEYDDSSHFQFTCEFLRVHSPSADVRGHGPGQGVLQVGKENVSISSIEPVGNYAIKLIFDDGHQTGIFSWDYLYDMGVHQEQYWQEYLAQLGKAGHMRKTE
jgi:DUF971 family protein